MVIVNLHRDEIRLVQIQEIQPCAGRIRISRAHLKTCTLRKGTLRLKAPTADAVQRKGHRDDGELHRTKPRQNFNHAPPKAGRAMNLMQAAEAPWTFPSRATRPSLIPGHGRVARDCHACRCCQLKRLRRRRQRRRPRGIFKNVLLLLLFLLFVLLFILLNFRWRIKNQTNQTNSAKQVAASISLSRSLVLYFPPGLHFPRSPSLSFILNPVPPPLLLLTHQARRGAACQWRTPPASQSRAWRAASTTRSRTDAAPT